MKYFSLSFFDSNDVGNCVITGKSALDAIQRQYPAAEIEPRGNCGIIFYVWENNRLIRRAMVCSLVPEQVKESCGKLYPLALCA